MPLACSRRHLGGSEPRHRARQFSQSFLGGIFEERPAQMDMEKPPAWFHWSFLFLVNLAALTAARLLILGSRCRVLNNATAMMVHLDQKVVNGEGSKFNLKKPALFMLIDDRTGVAQSDRIAAGQPRLHPLANAWALWANLMALVRWP